LPDLSRGWLPRFHVASRNAWIASLVLLVLASTASAALYGRTNDVPPREPLAAFPLRVGTWIGQRQNMEPDIFRTLKLTDYLLRNYMAPDEPVGINLYIAYYESQRKGEAVHSPRSCIPGDGWQIESLSQVAVGDIPGVAGGKVTVNRVVIAKGRLRQVVYYWFQQRGRGLTNEYLVKWFLFWDGMTRNRTDGALVRLVTLLDPSEASDAADKRLAGFLRQIYPQLPSYVPD